MGGLWLLVSDLPPIQRVSSSWTCRLFGDSVDMVDMVDPLDMINTLDMVNMATVDLDIFVGLGPIIVLPCQKLSHSMLLSLNDTTVVC